MCLSLRYPGSQGKQYFVGLEAVLGGSGDPAYPGTHADMGGTGGCLCAKLSTTSVWQLALLTCVVF